MANLIPQTPPQGLNWTGILDQWSAMKEDISAVLYFPYGDEYARSMSSLMMAFGQTQTIYAPDWSWFEKDRLVVSMTVENGPVSRASGVYTVDIPADEVDTVTGYSWPAPTDVWEHAASGAQFYIDDKPDANTFVLRPTKASTNVILGDGDKLFYIRQTSPERSGGPLAKYSFSTKKTVSVDIQRHAKSASGSALFNQMWYTQTEAGVQTPYSNSADVRELEQLHNISILHSFLAGVESDNISSDDSFGSFDGLDQTIEDFGQNEDTDGSPDVSDFYAMDAKLSQQDGSVRNYQVLMGGRVYGQINQSMLEYLKQTDLSTTRTELNQAFFGGGEMTSAMKTTLDFGALTLQGKNYALTRLGFLDNPETFNVPMVSGINPWQDKAWFIPIGSDASDGNGNDSSLGKYVRLVHKPGRYRKMWYTGAMADKNQTRVDELNIDILSEYALAFINANKYGRFFD